MKKRAEPRVRKQLILEAALKLARKKGYNKLIRDEIAVAAGVSTGLVTHYFKTMTNLKRSVMRYAIRIEDLSVIAQGLAHGDRHARKVPTELKNRAALFLAGN